MRRIKGKDRQTGFVPARANIALGNLPPLSSCQAVVHSAAAAAAVFVENYFYPQITLMQSLCHFTTLIHSILTTSWTWGAISFYNGTTPTSVALPCPGGIIRWELIFINQVDISKI